MTEFKITPTSSNSADCDPIPLRVTGKSRLVFCPELVHNEKASAACVRGTFVYQKKNKKDEWERPSLTENSLAALKSGEGYKLELKAQELLDLMHGLASLYRLYGQVGIPARRTKFVKAELGLARFLEMNQGDLSHFLETHSQDAAKILQKLIGWIAKSQQGAIALSRISAADLPNVTAILGLSGIKSALNYWTENRQSDDEEFWQEALAKRAYVLSQAYSYPVVIIKSKAYLGGKTFENTGGKLADFLIAAESTRGALIVEIKTPKTKLLGKPYRDGVYPFSPDLSGAIAQGLNYQRNLGLDFRSISANSEKKLLMGEPRCLIIAGDTKAEFSNDEMRQCFELQRERLQGVTVIRFDELFHKVRKLVDLLEDSDFGFTDIDPSF